MSAGETRAPAPAGAGAAAIVARWEWRTFGERFGPADSRFAGAAPDRVHESDELYLLSRRGNASVKVRDGLMDVKRLQRVDADGLEQWLPVLKQAFPLAAAEVRLVLDALGVPEVRPAREEYALDELVDELVAPNAELRAVGVHKRRARYTLAGCMAELTDIRVGEGATRTIAVESDRPELVTALVHELGFATRPNVSLARGLKALTGLAPRRYAVVDVGTNSVKFHVGELHPGGAWTTVVDRAEVTRLGEGLEERGELGAEPIERTAEAVAGMAAEAARLEAGALVAVGTAGLRAAPNRAAFLDAVEGRCGVRVQVISGEEEARLAYLAARAAAGDVRGALCVFDTGGGSSQFTFGDGESIREQFSVPVGAVRFTERFGLDGAVSEEVVARALDAVGRDLERLDGREPPDAVVAMGGAVTNLAAVQHGLAEYDPAVVQGTELTRAEVDRQIDLYRRRSADERRELPGLQPKRAEVILAGACVVRTVMAKLGRDAVVVSDRGLRHGLLAERFGGAAAEAS